MPWRRWVGQGQSPTPKMKCADEKPCRCERHQMRPRFPSQILSFGGHLGLPNPAPTQIISKLQGTTSLAGLPPASLHRWPSILGHRSDQLLGRSSGKAKIQSHCSDKLLTSFPCAADCDEDLQMPQTGQLKRINEQLLSCSPIALSWLPVLRFFTEKLCAMSAAGPCPETSATAACTSRKPQAGHQQVPFIDCTEELWLSLRRHSTENPLSYES